MECFDEEFIKWIPTIATVTFLAVTWVRHCKTKIRAEQTVLALENLLCPSPQESGLGPAELAFVHQTARYARELFADGYHADAIIAVSDCYKELYGEAQTDESAPECSRRHPQWDYESHGVDEIELEEHY